MTRFVHDLVTEAGGSISAEHGIGQMKRDELARLLPPVYVWRIRSKIYRWYRVLREVDKTVRAAPQQAGDPTALAPELAILRQMDREISDQKIPLSYMSEVYNLRMHTDYLRRRIEAVRGGQAADRRA